MGIFDFLFGKKSEQSAPVRPQPVSTPVAPSNDYCAYDYKRDDAYFDNIINEANFPGYGIERNVHPSVYDVMAHPSCLPISHLIIKGDEAVLAVMVMNVNQRGSMIAKGTYEILDKNNIPYVRFYRSMKNDEEYVTERIKSYL